MFGTIFRADAAFAAMTVAEGLRDARDCNERVHHGGASNRGLRLVDRPWRGAPGCRAEQRYGHSADRLKEMGMKGRAWMGRDFS